jgi:hypothetical protein
MSQVQCRLLLGDLYRLHEVMIEKDGKRITTRTHVKGQVESVFQAASASLPQNVMQTSVRAPPTR